MLTAIFWVLLGVVLGAAFSPFWIKVWNALKPGFVYVGGKLKELVGKVLPVYKDKD